MDEEAADFLLTALDILRGLAHAHSLGWVDCHSFDIEDLLCCTFMTTCSSTTMINLSVDFPSSPPSN
eukprot:4197469-Amphidinium_carterae.1